MLTHWRSIPLTDLLAANGLDGVTEEPFPNDGWSGAGLTRLRRGDDAFVLKRTSWAVDWIARATRDHAIREAFVAGGQLPLPAGVTAPHLGSASEGSTAAMLMPDLTGILLDWALPITTAGLDRVLDRLAALHATPPGPDDFPWCPIRERLELLTPHAAERYRAGGLSVGERFLAGWAAFHRRAPAAARDLVERLSVDAGPLVDALDRLPPALLHGDLKLANVGFRDGAMTLIDWQMVTAAPVSVELGWFLVSNVASLPLPPDAVLERYRDAGRRAGVDLAAWDAQVDLTWIVGLLLRGWRKGLDAEAATATGSGVSGGDDLAWWSGQAVEAADRRL